MPQFSTPTHWVEVSRPSTLWSILQRIEDFVRQRRRAAHYRRTLASLSDAQLEDAGIDRTIARGKKPVIPVDVRLTTYMASLR